MNVEKGIRWIAPMIYSQSFFECHRTVTFICYTVFMKDHKIGSHEWCAGRWDAGRPGKRAGR